jgi:glycosyltransferase involved in cell wall biosynthesis
LAPEDIERARRTLPLLRERLEQQEAEFWHSLDHFIAVTQRAATDKQQAKRELSAGKRLEKRDLLARELLDTQTFITGDLPSIGVLVINPEGSAPSLRRSLSSIADCAKAGLAIVALVIPAGAVGSGGARLIDDINQVAAASACDWLLVIQAGEELTLNGALMTSLQLAKMGGHRAVYADEVIRAEHGKFDTALRPDINVDLLLSAPALFGRHWMFRRDLWEHMGKFSADYPEAFEFEFILRLLQVGGSNGLGHIAEPLLIAQRPVLADAPQTRQVIERYLQRRGFDAAQVPADPAGRYALDYGHGESPVVSILILLEGQLLHAQRCLDSLLANTSYQQYEIILLDRGNDDSQVVEWLAGIEQMGAAQLRVLRFTADSSPLAIRNHGATQARGEFLLFLDSTAGITSRNWIQQLLNHALRPEVGCVGGKLLNGDGRVRHSFALLGLGGTLGDPFAGMGAGESGYMERLQVDQNCAAISGECLMLRQDLFTSAGGFDTSMASWADQDLCMRLSQAGYLNVWTPRVQVLINAPALPLATDAEQDQLYDRWLPALVQDPAYNANLSLVAGAGFTMAANAWSMPAAMVESALPLVLAHPTKDLMYGQSKWLLPLSTLQAQGELKGIVSKTLYSVVELQRCNPDVIMLQRQLGEDALQAMRRMKTYSTAFKVYELDRYLPDTPKPGFNSGNFGVDILDVLRVGASYMDRVVVPTPMLASVFESFSADLRIVEPRLDPATWGRLRSLRQVAGKPRIGLGIRGAHAADLALLTDLIGSLAGSVEWVLIGDCPAHLRAFMHEVHNDLRVAYSATLSALNLDLALVPLQSTLANRCKSNEQLLEFGACGVPVICSDLEAHRGTLPVTLVADGAEHWMEAVRSHLAEPEAMQRLGDNLQACVRRDWMLEGANLDAWRDAWLVH